MIYRVNFYKIDKPIFNTLIVLIFQYLLTNF